MPQEAVTTKAYSRAVGTEIWARMRTAGFRQSDLAERLGLSQGAVSRRINGETAFDVTELQATARWLGCSVVDLLGRIDEAAEVAS